MIGEKKDDDDAGSSAAVKVLDKSAVLQEVRAFNDPQIDPRRCVELIGSLLRLISRGDVLTPNECQDVFFGSTKLFQCPDERLRRMVYLLIKELRPSADIVFIVTASLNKDMTGSNDNFRSNALRVMCQITDAQMLLQVERFIKQACVDKHAAVSSAALVSGLQLLKKNNDSVKRWQNEVSQALSDRRSPMTQYHALALLYAIKKHDRLAVSKLVAANVKAAQTSPLAMCLLVRTVAQLIRENPASRNDAVLNDFLDNALRFHNDMVIFEAASCIVSLPDASTRDFNAVVGACQSFLTSQKPTRRYGALRLLSRIASLNAAAVATCNLDLESLLTDSNRAIATLAITTLLKTGAENSVERLMKQMQSFLSDISDDHKIVVVEAIRSLCFKYPSKHRVLISHLQSILRDEGGHDFKRAVVNAILNVIEQLPESKDMGLGILCEFIEDCEYPNLSASILHILGQHGPSSATPSKYLRYIYNRIILETHQVRSAAVAALARFGACVPSLKADVEELLSRCCGDSDDECRDRATFFLLLLQSSNEELISRFIVNFSSFDASTIQEAAEAYLTAGDFSVPFNLGQARVNAALAESKAAAKAAADSRDAPPSKSDASAVKSSVASDAAAASSLAAEMLRGIPQFAKYGALFKSSPVHALTEKESEYVVSVQKHVFKTHIVLQFTVENTVEEFELRNVTVDINPSSFEGDCKVAGSVKCASVAFGTPGICFVALQYSGDAVPVGSSPATLRFDLVEDGVVSATDDEYTLETVDLLACDFCRPAAAVSELRSAWEAISSPNDIKEEFSLSIKDISQAYSTLSTAFGIPAVDGGNDLGPATKKARIIYRGEWVDGSVTMVVAELVKMKDGIEFVFSARGTSKNMVEFLLRSIS